MARAVDAAEEATGLQFCVYLGPSRDPLALFAETQPSVLLMVAPKDHRVEILTSPDAKERVTDAACEEAIRRMVADFKRGRIDRGIVHGVEYLAEMAGHGTASPDAVELPDVLD